MKVLVAGGGGREHAMVRALARSGTAKRDGEVVTAGGRVLNVTALGPTPAAARDRAYDAASRISFEGIQIRTDIAARAVESTAKLATPPAPHPSTSNGYRSE